MKMLSRKQSLSIWSAYILVVCLISHNVHAGLNATTAHSRANCGTINESITWFFNHNYNWRVISWHDNNRGDVHVFDTGKQYTWRCAAVHWVEAVPGNRSWKVTGQHFWFTDQGRQIYDTTTEVTDCSIYNGWWDH